MAGQGFGSWRHLAGRFFSALSPTGPGRDDEAWAVGHLLEGEQALWWRMSGPDRRHAISVARSTATLLGTGPPRDVVAAALLHDVGKVEAGLGTFARVAVTLAAIAVGRERLLRWSAPGDNSGGRGSSGPDVGRPGRLAVRARAGYYLTHDQVGARLLQDAGSEPLTVCWAREHHMPPSRWSLDHVVGEALKAADGD
jgi:hypothetical protein